MLLEESSLLLEESEERFGETMPSLNHSYVCTEIIGQLWQNKDFKPFIELTLDIDKGITPDVSVYPRHQIQPNFLRDVPRYKEMPVLAVEVISASQNIQDLLEKAEMLVNHGVKAVWTVEPFGNTVFVTTKDGTARHHNQAIESEGITVDFRQIF